MYQSQIQYRGFHYLNWSFNFLTITEHIGQLLYEITVLLIALVGISCNLLGIAFML